MNHIHRLLIVSSIAAFAVVGAACSDQSNEIVPPTAEPTQIAPAPTEAPAVEPTAVPSTATPSPTATPVPVTPTVIPPTAIPPTVTPIPVEITYPSEIANRDSFESDNEGWITGFADLPVDWTDDLYELATEFRQLPDGLEGNGIYIQGHNRSDDLFMFLTKKITDLKPNTNYEIHLAINIAANVPAAMMGIGGSPGESVYVKAGASTDEPTISSDDIGHLRISVDKGNQASHGSEMFSIGNVANFEVVGSEYKIKTLDNTGRTVTVSSDDSGQLWLIVGTDSGFEGLSTFYYSAIEYHLTIVE